MYLWIPWIACININILKLFWFFIHPEPNSFFVDFYYKKELIKETHLIVIINWWETKWNLFDPHTAYVTLYLLKICFRMCLHTFCFCRICESSTFIRLSFCFVLRATVEVNFKLCMVISSSFFSLMNTAGILESSSPVVQWRIFCLILFCVALGWTDTKNENLNVLSRYGNFLIILPRIIPIPLLNSVPETINYSVTIKSSQKT